MSDPSMAPVDCVDGKVLLSVLAQVKGGDFEARMPLEISDFEVLPIVAVIGTAAAGERQRCLDSGADGYIPKPVATCVLLAAPAPWLLAREVVVAK